MKKIIMFHGRDCPHCHAMMPIVDRISKEGEFQFEKLEVWHDEKNAQKMRSFSKIIGNSCGGDLGVPAFVDEENKRAFCGENSYEELKKWLKKK